MQIGPTKTMHQMNAHTPNGTTAANNHLKQELWESATCVNTCERPSTCPGTLNMSSLLLSIGICTYIYIHAYTVGTYIYTIFTFMYKGITGTCQKQRARSSRAKDKGNVAEARTLHVALRP